MSPYMRNFESLKDMVYQFLQNQIAKGKLKPGEKIRENEICCSMNISRTPVREALIKLEAEGFITILPRRGFIVKKITLKEIEDIYQIIGCLEGYAASTAVSKMNKTDFDLLIEFEKKMKKALSQGKYSDFNRYNILFHNVYLKAIDNQVIFDTVALLKKRIYEHTINIKVVPEWCRKVTEEHENILGLFKKRAANELEKYIREVHWNFEGNLPFIKEELSF